MAEIPRRVVRGVYPLRKRFGFRFVGAWVVEASDEFVWILGYEEPQGFAAADARDDAAAERAAVRADPPQLIAATDHRMIRTVRPEPAFQGSFSGSTRMSSSSSTTSRRRRAGAAFATSARSSCSAAGPLICTCSPG